MEEHLPVFDCAFRPMNGKRFIHYLGHIRMMSSVQPFLSGAISKTVNLPSNTTVEDIVEVYIEAWRLRLKSVASRYSALSGLVRAEPKMETFRLPA